MQPHSQGRDDVNPGDNAGRCVEDAGKFRPRGVLRIALPVLVIAIVVAALELSSAVLLRFASGSWVGPRDLAHMQEATIEQSSGDGGAPESSEAAETTSDIFSIRRALHPFIGYVLDRDFIESARLRLGGPDAIEYGFHLGAPGIFLSPSPDRLVIAVTGGSLACSFGRQMSTRPQQDLLRPPPGVREIHLVNLALPGHKQPQQLMTLAWFLALGAHFDVVLNLDGFNDVVLGPAENLPAGIAPVFPRGWQYLAGTLTTEQLRLSGRLEYLQGRRSDLARVFHHRPLSWSLAAGLVWNRLDLAAGARVAATATDLAEASLRSGLPFAVSGPHRKYPDAETLYADLAGLWMRSSLEMKALAEAHGASYVHALQPNQYVPGSKPMGASERAVAWRERHPQKVHVERGYPFLLRQAQVLRREGVTFLDLTMIFHDVEEPLYIDPCCHLSPKGNELMAKAIEPALAKRPDT